MAVAASTLSCYPTTNISLPIRPTSSLKPNSLSAALLSSAFTTQLTLKTPTSTKPISRKRFSIISMSVEAGIGVMGTKLGMMSYFEAEGKVVPVTVVGFKEGNIVTQIKTEAMLRSGID